MLKQFKWYRKWHGGTWYLYQVLERNKHSPYEYDIIKHFWSDIPNLEKPNEIKLIETENYGK